MKLAPSPYNPSNGVRIKSNNATQRTTSLQLKKHPDKQQAIFFPYFRVDSTPNLPLPSRNKNNWRFVTRRIRISFLTIGNHCKRTRIITNSRQSIWPFFRWHQYLPIFLPVHHIYAKELCDNQGSRFSSILPQ